MTKSIAENSLVILLKEIMAVDPGGYSKNCEGFGSVLLIILASSAIPGLWARISRHFVSILRTAVTSSCDFARYRNGKKSTGHDSFRPVKLCLVRFESDTKACVGQ